MNASLARRVIFSRLFSNQNYFYSTFLKVSILQLIFAIYLLFSSNFIIQMANDRRCNCNNDVDIPPSTLEQFLSFRHNSSDCAINPGANARRQPTDAIYRRKTLIKKEIE
jgi:hypothetical protein